MSTPLLLERDHSSVTVCWTKLPSEQALCYELEMINSVDSAWVSLSNSLKGNSIRKRNLSKGVGYKFRLRFLSADGSSWSDFTPSSDEYFVLPSDFKMMEPPVMSSKDDISVTLLWQEVSGAEGYALRYRTDEGPSNSAAGNDGACWTKVGSIIKGNTVRKKGLQSGSSYYFSIMPVGFGDADDGTSNNWSFSASSAACRVATMAPFMQKLFPKTLLVKDELLAGAGAVIGAGGGALAPTTSVLSGGKGVAMYFSAHWCGPCRQFTPKLLELYAQCKVQNKRFEVVFCSADHSAEEFSTYYSSMAWPAIEFDEENREGLMGMFKVSGIPRLSVLAANGRIIVDNAITGTSITTSTVDQWIQMSENMK